MRALFATVAVSAAALAQAHEGHGLQGVHWHATDAWGFLIAAAAGAAAWWLGRGRK